MGMSKGRVLGLFIGLLLALGAAEFLGRLMTSSARHLPRTPNLEVQLYPEQAELFGIRGETRHTTSSIGLRGPEPKTTDRLHILCVGGSTTACEYLDDQETWPQLLAAQFPETPTWVGNAGLSGHRAIDHVTLLSKLVDEQKPKQVSMPGCKACAADAGKSPPSKTLPQGPMPKDARYARSTCPQARLCRPLIRP